MKSLIRSKWRLYKILWRAKTCALNVVAVEFCRFLPDIDIYSLLNEKNSFDCFVFQNKDAPYWIKKKGFFDYCFLFVLNVVAVECCRFLPAINGYSSLNLKKKSFDRCHFQNKDAPYLRIDVHQEGNFGAGKLQQC